MSPSALRALWQVKQTAKQRTSNETLGTGVALSEKAPRVLVRNHYRSVVLSHDRQARVLKALDLPMDGEPDSSGCQWLYPSPPSRQKRSPCIGKGLGLRAIVPNGKSDRPNGIV
ncbi:unnamed protein product [Prunus armeniaca]